MTAAIKITVETAINATVEKVWQAWNNPEDIKQWNFSDPSWHCPASENDLSIGGSFTHRMEAKDGSFGFDFEGVYDKIELHREISYTMPDGRLVRSWFKEQDGRTILTSTFDAETKNDPELQKQGWQAILDQFKSYVESKK